MIEPTIKQVPEKINSTLFLAEGQIIFIRKPNKYYQNIKVGLHWVSAAPVTMIAHYITIEFGSFVQITFTSFLIFSFVYFT